MAGVLDQEPQPRRGLGADLENPRVPPPGDKVADPGGAEPLDNGRERVSVRPVVVGGGDVEDGPVDRGAGEDGAGEDRVGVPATLGRRTAAVPC